METTAAGSLVGLLGVVKRMRRSGAVRRLLGYLVGDACCKGIMLATARVGDIWGVNLLPPAFSSAGCTGILLVVGCLLFFCVFLLLIQQSSRSVER
jgi:hypothetical protein